MHTCCVAIFLMLGVVVMQQAMCPSARLPSRARCCCCLLFHMADPGRAELVPLGGGHTSAASCVLALGRCDRPITSRRRGRHLRSSHLGASPTRFPLRRVSLPVAASCFVTRSDYPESVPTSRPARPTHPPSTHTLAAQSPSSVGASLVQLSPLAPYFQPLRTHPRPYRFHLYIRSMSKRREKHINTEKWRNIQLDLASRGEQFCSSPSTRSSRPAGRCNLSHRAVQLPLVALEPCAPDVQSATSAAPRLEFGGPLRLANQPSSVGNRAAV